MELTIGKWGNSRGIRIPKQLIDELNLADGMTVEAETRDGCLVLRPVKKNRAYSIEQLVDEIQSKPDAQPADWEWDAPVGKEAW